MADNYGAITIASLSGAATPVANPPAVMDVGDPLLGFVADYIKNVLVAYTTTLWQTVAPGTPVVSQVRLHDPAQNSFNEKDLPAIYAFRDDNVSTQLQWDADDYRFMRTILHVLWVPPASVQAQRRQRVAILNALSKVIDRAIELGRDPAWVLTGDADPQAAASGSQICPFAGCTAIELRSLKWTKITIPMIDGTTKQYDALALDADVEELLTKDITVFPVNFVQAEFQSPDQGTGLGPFDLGDAIYR